MRFALLGIFIAILVMSGLLNVRKNTTVQSFFLGDRGIGPWFSAFAYGTTYFSAVIFIGYAGKVGWGFGLSALWIVLGNTLVGSLLAWKILARRTREMTVRLNAITMPEFLGARYQDKGLKIFSAIIIFIFLVPYSASVYMGLSYLFEQVFGIPYTYALVFMAVLTAVYLVLGGYRAVAVTDFIQGMVMVVGVGVLLYYIIGSPQVGGLTSAVKKLAEINPGLAAPVGPPGWLPLFSLVALTSIGPWGLPQMVQKYYALKDEKSIRPAMIISTVFALIVTFGAYFTGSLSRLFFEKLPIDPTTGVATPDLLMPQILSTALPELGVTIIFLLVLSASMSTLASLVLVSSSTLAVDMVQGWLKPNMSERAGVRLMRLLVVAFVALSLLVAMVKPAFILTLMALSWGTVAGFFLAPYLYGLFWQRTTKAGAWAGGLTGLSVSLGLSVYYHMDAGLIPLIGVLGMIIPLAVVPLVSLVTQPLPSVHLDKVFNLNQNKELKPKSWQASQEEKVYDMG
ncbi:sodium:solute symporter [Paradesulfitobacterium aromaticivorans]